MAAALVAVAAATALAQAYQSEKARGANKDILDQMRREFEALIPPEYDVSIMDPPAFIKQAIPEPSLDMSSITPEQYAIVGKYKPELAPLIAEARPELLKDTAGMKEGRDAQLSALRRLKSIGENREGDPELRQKIADAGQQSQMQAQSRQQSILQDLARRGMMGSGAGMASQMQAGSDSMQNAARSSQDAAVASYRNQLQSLRDSAQIGGQVRQDDERTEGRNVDIINDFNQRTSRNRQAWENSRVGSLNDAQRMNLSAEQQVSDSNVAQNNRSAVSERDRKDSLNKYLYDIRRDERGTQNRMVESEAGWRRGERDNQNELKGKMFDDQARIVAGKNGLNSAGMAMNSQTAQDRNQMVQGIGNAVTGGITQYQDRQDREQDREERKNYYGY